MIKDVLFVLGGFKVGMRLDNILAAMGEKGELVGDAYFETLALATTRLSTIKLTFIDDIKYIN